MGKKIIEHTKGAVEKITHNAKYGLTTTKWFDPIVITNDFENGKKIVYTRTELFLEQEKPFGSREKEKCVRIDWDETQMPQQSIIDLVREIRLKRTQINKIALQEMHQDLKG